MAEAVSFEQPRIEEDTLPVFETPYDELATFEVAGDDSPGRFQQLFQEYGRKVGVLLLAGSALVACEPGDQTTSVGSARPMKVLSIGGGQIETGNCVLQKQAGQDNPGHNCMPQTSDLKNQTVEQVREASEGGLFGGTDKHTIQSSEKSCDGPGAAFVNSLRVGSVIAKEQKRHADYSVKPTKITKYCDWSVK